MNTLLVLALLGTGPFSAAIKQNTPQPTPEVTVSNDMEWLEVAVTGTTLQLPVMKSKGYTRTAPANYKVPMPTKTVPVWCPQAPTWRHGYSCGMNKAVEDLAGHLQTVHKVSLEALNEMERTNWQDYHDDLHWCDEPLTRQATFTNPPAPPAPAVPKSGCANGNCPTGNCPTQSYQSIRRGLWR